MNSCQIGSLTYKYAYFLQNGRKEADTLFCKLSWLVAAQPVIDSYIEVGTLISDAGSNACGLTNSVIGFAPVPPPPLTFQITLLDYNGTPIVIVTLFNTVLEAMDAIIAALTTASGVQWSYTQISQFEFLLCAPYTQNGDTVVIFIEVFQEGSLGLVTMSVELSGGVAPETPARYQTDADNCNITAPQHEQMVETANWVTHGIRCCDISRPSIVVCENNGGNVNIELRESNDYELREDAN